MKWTPNCLQKKETLKLTSYSNFFKSELYYELVLKSIDELDNYDDDKYVYSFIKMILCNIQYEEIAE